MGERLTVGSLFAGIGGFDLAAERVGWQVKWQVEIDDYCTKVLEKHWPHVRRYRDVRTIDWSEVEPVDLVCGGFPCQPHSLAGRRLAAADDRDLWPEVVRCLRGVKPGLFVGENVSGLLSSDAGRFFGTVLRDLAACGYDAEWDCIPAAAVGAPHRRDRVWIVAHANGKRLARSRPVISVEPTRCESGSWRTLAAAARDGSIASVVAGCAALPKPLLCGADDGVSAWVDRLRGVGNSIVPQVAEWIFRQIQAAEESVTR